MVMRFGKTYSAVKNRPLKVMFQTSEMVGYFFVTKAAIFDDNFIISNDSSEKQQVYYDGER